MDSDRENAHLVMNADEVLGRRDICRAFDKAPHVPIAGTPTLSICSEKLQEDVPFLDDTIASCAIDVSSRYSLLIPVRPENSGGLGCLSFSSDRRFWAAKVHSNGRRWGQEEESLGGPSL